MFDLNEIENKELVETEDLVEIEVDAEELAETEVKTEELVETEEFQEIEIKIDKDSSSENQTEKIDNLKELRNNYKALKKEKKELESKLAAVSGFEKKEETQVSQKPTLESCDYNTDKFANDLENWFHKQEKIKHAEVQKQTEIENANKQWQLKLNNYSSLKESLKVKDFEDSEELVKDSLSTVQQGIMLKGCKNAALVVYALGKNPKKLKQLADFKDPVEFAFAISNLENNEMKVTKKSAAPAPEKVISGAGFANSNKMLERLEAEADKTGDRTKILEYKRKLKLQGK